MAAPKRFRTREDLGVPTEDLQRLQVRVSPEVREAVTLASERSGMSVSFYIELLLRQAMDAGGNLPVLAMPQVSQVRQEALDVSAA